MERLLPSFAQLATERPRRMRIPRSRRLTIDVLHYRAKVPTCATIACATFDPWPRPAIAARCGSPGR